MEENIRPPELIGKNLLNREAARIWAKCYLKMLDAQAREAAQPSQSPTAQPAA